MDDMIKYALTLYGIEPSEHEEINDHCFKITDKTGCKFILKIYNKANDYDIIKGARLYHTREQLQTEAEILLALSATILKTPSPVKNNNNNFVSEIGTDTDGEPVYAMLTSYVDGLVLGQEDKLTDDLAFISGECAARFHLESEENLLPLAVKRPHKRQDYVKQIQERLSAGTVNGVLTDGQYDIIKKCCAAVIECMDRLDSDPKRNVGLVHTDIRNTNIIYRQKNGTLIDFSRSAYSYYLYDLAEMSLHGSFGGANRSFQKEILRGYHSVKPLTEYDIYATQTLFAMFILMVMAEVLTIYTMNGLKIWR